MRELRRVVSALESATADPDLRGPLVLFCDQDGEHELRVPPHDVTPGAFVCGLRGGIRRSGARAVGVVLPVRTLWGKREVCDYGDAEALILVAAEDGGRGVWSAGLVCPLHRLPDGWTEAHEELQWLAKPLRQMLANRPLEDTEGTLDQEPT